jgi:hypothetical protein
MHSPALSQYGASASDGIHRGNPTVTNRRADADGPLNQQGLMAVWPFYETQKPSHRLSDFPTRRKCAFRIKR